MPGAEQGRNRWWKKYERLVSDPLKEFHSGLRQALPGKNGFADRGVLFRKRTFNPAKIMQGLDQ
jgi:hypothetical protein